ncbi:MAG: ferredoxin [Jatrophihabitans sp.]|uniref:ferredoxin n=1 Tax=Jatrophihabitans sp. TaxID=1932789 RepID=UPI003F7FB151
MRIVVDRDRCEGLGMCEAMAHEYFEVGEDGYVTVLDDTPPEAKRAEIQAAVDACPVAALSLRD